MSRTAIKPFEAPVASAEEWAQARSTCAARARDRGHMALADAFEAGSQDQGFAMRHEINRIRNEAEGSA